MTPQISQRPGRGRALIWRLVAGTGAGVAALAVPALPSAGAATMTHNTIGAGPAVPAATGGMLRTWGFNADGELGNGKTDNSDVPVKPELPAGTKITEVRGGCDFTIALTSTGKVFTWGSNSLGQLGTGVTGGASPVPAPVAMSAGVKIKDVRAGCQHALALTTTGQVYAWGSGFTGQLGDGLLSDFNHPVLVDIPPGVKITQIAAGGFHNLALASSGTAVFAWGRNTSGQLGDPNVDKSASPLLVPLAAGTIVKGLAASDSDSLAVTSTGQALVWGDDSFGQLGDNFAHSRSATPVFASVPPGVEVVGAVAGDEHFLARTANGLVLGWGLDIEGEVGDGNFNGQGVGVPTFADLPGGVTVKALAAGVKHSYALTSQGTILAWGQGNSGELGNGMFSNSLTPVQVRLPKTLVVTAISGGPDSGVGSAIVHQR